MSVETFSWKLTRQGFDGSPEVYFELPLADSNAIISISNVYAHLMYSCVSLRVPLFACALSKPIFEMSWQIGWDCRTTCSRLLLLAPRFSLKLHSQFVIAEVISLNTEQHGFMFCIIEIFPGTRDMRGKASAGSAPHAGSVIIKRLSRPKSTAALSFHEPLRPKV